MQNTSRIIRHLLAVLFRAKLPFDTAAGHCQQCSAVTPLPRCQHGSHSVPGAAHTAQPFPPVSAWELPPEWCLQRCEGTIRVK